MTTLEALQPVLTALVGLLGVLLGARLTLSLQRAQVRLDLLNRRMEALGEVMGVVSNVPPRLTAAELLPALESDERIRTIPDRMVRLLGLRQGLIGTLDRELVSLIDTRFRPLYVERAGIFEMPGDRRREFAAAATELRELVGRVEQKLLAEQERLTR